MLVLQRVRLAAEWGAPTGALDGPAQLVLVFGGTGALESDAWRGELAREHPDALVVGCSTAGEIIDGRVLDDTVVATAVRFRATQVRMARVAVSEPEGSRDAGLALARQLLWPELVHVLVLSDGLVVNGTALVAGLLSQLPPGVTVTGGLAGDGDRMRRTLVCAGGEVAPQQIVAVGFYGASLSVGYGCRGGWDPFGPERLITRAHGAVLEELDHRRALDLYREYLGEHARELPASALRFPLSVRPPEGGPRVVRTILGIDEASASMTFAGDMPEGHYAQLMKANFDRLVDGAYGAARITSERAGRAASLALLISCVGRRLVLRQRVEEELEGVREILGPVPTTGFYSYGELCPTGQLGCELHNQTMTVTTFAEA
jgi:hypothetical protein